MLTAMRCSGLSKRSRVLGEKARRTPRFKSFRMRPMGFLLLSPSPSSATRSMISCDCTRTHLVMVQVIISSGHVHELCVRRV